MNPLVEATAVLFATNAAMIQAGAESVGPTLNVLLALLRGHWTAEAAQTAPASNPDLACQAATTGGAAHE